LIIFLPTRTPPTMNPKGLESLFLTPPRSRVFAARNVCSPHQRSFGVEPAFPYVAQVVPSQPLLPRSPRPSKVAMRHLSVAPCASQKGTWRFFVRDNSPVASLRSPPSQYVFTPFSCPPFFRGRPARLLWRPLVFANISLETVFPFQGGTPDLISSPFDPLGPPRSCILGHPCYTIPSIFFTYLPGVRCLPLR